MAARFATGWRRFFPLVGYHHVLMILIAIAIVLLCEYPSLQNPIVNRTLMVSSGSTSPRRLLIDISGHPRHLPDISLLPKVSTRLRFSTSTARRDNGSCKHRRLSTTRSQGRVLRHMHTTRWWSVPVQSECFGSGRLGQSRSGPTESDMGCIDL